MPYPYGSYFGLGVTPSLSVPPATIANRAAIEKRVYSYLSEPIGSPFAQLGETGTQTAIITTPDQIAKVAWEAACAHCRSCFPVPATGNRIINEGASNASARLDTFTVTSIEGNSLPAGVAPTLWSTRQNGVTVDGKNIQRLDVPVFEAMYNRGTLWGTIKHYCRDGKSDVLRFGPPADSDDHTVTVEGLVLPAPLRTTVSDTHGFSYMIPDDIVLSGICAHAAVLLIEQQKDDVQLDARKAWLISLVNEIRVREWTKISPDRRKAHYGDNLVLLQTPAAKQ